MKTSPWLMGVAILFWGLEKRQLVLASVMAAVVVASQWLTHRWDLKEDDFKTVSTLCTLTIVGLALYQLLTGWFTHPAWMIFIWLPVVLLPLLLAQIYSTAGRINLSVLFLLRKKQILDKHNKLRSVDVSPFYLAICVLSAGFINERNGLFYAGLLMVAAWALWPYRPRPAQWVVWIVLLLTAGGAGYVGQIGLARLQTVVEQKTTHLFANSEDSYRKYTQIGDIPDEKLSSRIVFRARPGGPDERSLLLREATYDTFRSFPSIWSVSRKYFKRLPQNTDRFSWTLATETTDARTYAIAQYLKGKDTLLKLPGGAFHIDNLDVDRADKNDFGAVKVRGDGLSCYTIRYGMGSPLISPPGTLDLNIPPRELAVIQHIAGQLKLQSVPPSEILHKIESYFATEFTYSLKQESKQRHLTPVQNFLTHTRSGHCEFFATATVLLLRQAGVPARYARGYAVNPSDTMDGWNLVRARYAHAWAVAYVNNAWVNVDTTPGSWQTIEHNQQSYWQKYGQPLKDVVSTVMFRLVQWQQRMHKKGYLRYALWLLLPLFAGALWRLLTRFFKGWKFKQTDTLKREQFIKKVGFDSDFYRIEQRLSALASRRYPWEALSLWLDRIESVIDQNISLDIPRRLLDLHYRYRFDPQGLNATEKMRMTKLSAAWLAENDPKLIAPQKGRNP